MGVNRRGHTSTSAANSIPHACGGEPFYAKLRFVYPQRIPHACGGEPFTELTGGIGTFVFPTRVGVNRRRRRPCGPATRIPHACGGEPEWDARVANASAYSPRVWG